jgi:hypothetical protein
MHSPSVFKQFILAMAVGKSADDNVITTSASR